MTIIWMFVVWSSLLKTRMMVLFKLCANMCCSDCNWCAIVCSDDCNWCAIVCSDDCNWCAIVCATTALLTGQEPAIVDGAAAYLMRCVPALFTHAIDQCVCRYMVVQVHIGFAVCFVGFVWLVSWNPLYFFHKHRTERLAVCCVTVEERGATRTFVCLYM